MTSKQDMSHQLCLAGRDNSGSQFRDTAFLYHRIVALLRSSLNFIQFIVSAD